MGKKRANKPKIVTLPDGKQWEFTDGLGEVAVVDGEQRVCLGGLIERLGLGARQSPEFAACVFPAFDLLPGEERPDPGEVVEDLPVFCWISQQDAAKAMLLTTRQVANLEIRGLPHKGFRDSKRYPLPHLHIWAEAYRRRVDRNETVRKLPFSLALAEHELRQAQDRLRDAEAAA